MIEDGGYGKWDMIKKSLLVQAGVAGVIRSDPGRKKEGYNPKKIKRKIKKSNMVPQQQELF
jgi:hypothetical protein